MKKLILFLIWTGLCQALFPETQISVSIPVNKARIGDLIRVKIILKTTDLIDKVKVFAEKNEFEIISQDNSVKRPEQNYTIIEKTIQVAFFKLGNFNIGPLKVQLIRNNQVLETKETNAIPVLIESVLEKGDKDIKPLKPPIQIRGNPLYLLKYALAALLIVLLALALWLWLRKKKSGAGSAVEERLSPLAELEKRIQGLAADRLLDKGEFKLFFLKLTSILKHFLERQYEFNAGDLTTEETLQRLGGKEQLVLIRNHMAFVFNTSDLVKFAKYIPQKEELAQLEAKLAESLETYQKRENLAREQQK